MRFEVNSNNFTNSPWQAHFETFSSNSPEIIKRGSKTNISLSKLIHFKLVKGQQSTHTDALWYSEIMKLELDQLRKDNEAHSQITIWIVKNLKLKFRF